MSPTPEPTPKKKASPTYIDEDGAERPCRRRIDFVRDVRGGGNGGGGGGGSLSYGPMWSISAVSAIVALLVGSFAVYGYLSAPLHERLNKLERDIERLEQAERDDLRSRLQALERKGGAGAR